jgi:predicted dehydrogenase
LSNHVPRLRTVVIGLGYGQQVLVPAFQSLSNCDVIGVCASRIQKAETVAAKLGVPIAFKDWRAVVDDAQVEAVAIAVPPTLQPEIALEAMRRGKHIFCEKPVAVTLEEAATLAKEAAKSGVANVVDFEFCAVPEWLAARELLKDGQVGQIRQVVVTWLVETYANRMKLVTWKRAASQGGGALNSLLSHTLFLIEWLVGPVREITASLHAPGSDRQIPDEDSVALLTLELDEAVVGIVASTASPHGSGHRIELYGTNGTLVLNNPSKDYVTGFELLLARRAAAEFERVDVATLDVTEMDGRAAATRVLAQRFVTWAQGGVAAMPDLSHGYRVQVLLDAAQRSAQTRRPVAL